MQKPFISILADSALYITPHITGSMVQQYNLAVMFAGKGHSVSYHFVGPQPTKNHTKEYSSVLLIWLGNKKKRFSWLSDLRRYRHSLAKQNPDVVYVRGRSVLCYVAGKWAKQNQKQFVWATNGDDSCEYWKRCRLVWKSERNSLLKIALLPLSFIEDCFINRGMRMATRVISQSHFQRTELQNKLGKPGIILPSIYPEIKLNVQKENLVLWLASLHKGKNPEAFIHLALELADKTDWKFILAGGTADKMYSRAIHEKAKSVKNLQVIGSVPFAETNTWFTKASIFISTSVHEGFSNTYIQAWLCGAPVLSLYHDPDNLLKNQDIGMTFNGDIQKMADRLGTLINNPEQIEKMGRQAKKYASDKYSIKYQYSHYLQAFTSA